MQFKYSSESVSQEEIDSLAEDLRGHAQLLAEKYSISEGLDRDPDRVESYLESAEEGYGWSHHLEELDELTDRARNIFESAYPVVHEGNLEESRWRVMRKNGETPEEQNPANWRDGWRESSERLWENAEEPSLAPLIRAYVDVVEMAYELSENYNEHLEELIPETEGDDAEIIDSSEGSMDDPDNSWPLELVNQELTEINEELEKDSINYHPSLTADMLEQ